MYFVWSSVTFLQYFTFSAELNSSQFLECFLIIISKCYNIAKAIVAHASASAKAW